ncbi:MAG TPA: DUF1330 domain-containing protein [Acidisphaera sp.]|nr:DUF1330 domain-containing protein [Acidisphaera sp.]
MAPAYLIGNLQITDPARFQQYREPVEVQLARVGARFLVRGGAVTAVEGDPGLHRLIVIAFPDMTTLRTRHDSDDYAPLIRLRQSASTGWFTLAEGYAPAG